MDQSKSLNTIILVGQSDRQKISEQLGSLINYQVKVVSKLDEIEAKDWDRYKRIVVLENIVKTKDFIVEFEVFLDVYGVEAYYIGSDDVWLSTMSRRAKVYKMDVRELSYEMLEAVLYDDDVRLKEHVYRTAPMITEIAEDVIEKKDSDIEKLLLAEEYLSLRDLITEQEESIKDLSESLERVNSRAIYHQEESQRYQQSYASLFKSAIAMNRFTEQMSAVSVKDIYTKVDTGRFPNKPFILYLKEWQELLYFEDFILTLRDAFEYQLRRPTQVVRLMDSKDSKRILTVPEIYQRVGENFTVADVYTSKNIVRFGEYEKLLEMLLTNSNNMVEVLIVVDQKSHSDTVLTGSNVYLNMCRNEKHLSTFGISPNNTIVNNGGENMKFSLNYVEDLKDARTKEDEFALLSNQPVIQNILDLYRSVN